MTWYSSKELAELDLPGLSPDRDYINQLARKYKWEHRRRAGRGGGKEYPVSALPVEARKALTKRLRAAETKSLTVPSEVSAIVPDARFVKDWQKRAGEARATIIAYVEWHRVNASLTLSQAIDTVVEKMATAVTIENKDEHLERLVEVAKIANQRGGQERTISRATLYRWIKERDTAGSALVLMPKATPLKDTAPWAAAFMREYGRPTRPSVAESLRDMRWDGEKPSIDQVHRYLKKLSFFEKNRGRIGPKAMRSHKAYVSRDTSDLEAGYIFIGDGHTFKAQVAHPMHKRPFRPEVTTFLDVKTRKAVGYSVALAENAWAVADALRVACMRATVPAMLYYDNGSGANNVTFDGPVIGLIDALSIGKKVNSIAGNSQSRGIIERYHSSVLHRAAKKLPSYVGPDMDGDARFLQDRRLRRDVRETGTSSILLSWEDFYTFLKETVEDCNNRPHRSLPKVRDEETGKLRHQTPNEAWDESVSKGAELYPLSDEEAALLFRPYVIKTASRGLVSVFSQSYFNRILERYEGQDVQVGYDIHDPSRVYINDIEGRFVCEAIFNGNRDGYMPKAVVDIAREKRVAGQVKRLENKKAIAQEGLGTKQIEYSPEPVFDAEFLDLGARAMAEMETANVVAMPMKSNVRPKFVTDDGEMAAWLLDHPDQINDHDRTYFSRLLRDPSFALVLETYRIDPGVLREAIQKRAAL